MRPKDHYEQALGLLNFITDNKEDLDAPQAQVIATSAQAYVWLGVLKFLLDLDPYTFLRNNG